MAANVELDTSLDSQFQVEITVASTSSTLRKRRMPEADLLLAEQYAQEDDQRLSQDLASHAESEVRSEQRRRESEPVTNRYVIVSNVVFVCDLGGNTILKVLVGCTVNTTWCRRSSIKDTSMWNREPSSESIRLRTCCPELG